MATGLFPSKELILSREKHKFDFLPWKGMDRVLLAGICQTKMTLAATAKMKTATLRFFNENSHNLHRRRLLRKPRPRRLVRHSPLRGNRKAALRRRGEDNQQPHGADRRHHRSGCFKGAVRGDPLLRLPLHHRRHPGNPGQPGFHGNHSQGGGNDHFGFDGVREGGVFQRPCRADPGAGYSARPERSRRHGNVLPVRDRPECMRL